MTNSKQVSILSKIMNKQEKIDFIKDKAHNYIRFGKLLKKPRPSEYVQKVNTIARSTSTLEEKVKRIEAIDTTFDISYEERGEEEKKELTIKEAAQNRKNIKLYFKRNKFFNYLFFHWSKIRIYGNAVHTIHTGLWPFFLRMDDRFKEVFEQRIKRKYADFLYPKLDILLKTGWKHLTKQEYNILILFFSLLEKIKALSLENENLNDPGILHKMYGIEVFFLSLHYKKNYIDIIFSGISRLMLTNPDYEEQVDTSIKYVKGILMPNATIPSLYHFILSLSIVNSRLFLSFSQLINKSAAGIVSPENFDCNQETAVLIKTHIDTIIDNLKRLFEQKYEIVQLKLNLPIKRGQEVDYSNLKQFYNFFNLTKTDYDFDSDKENCSLFALRFINKFISSFKAILNGQVQLKKVKSVKIFDRDFFDADFNRMQLFHDKIANLLIKLPSFPRKRYLALKSSREGGISLEIEGIQLIDEALDIIWKIGKKLSTVILRREKKFFDDISQIPEFGFEEPIDIRSARKPSIVIPYENIPVDADDLFYGKTVIESLKFISSICYLSSFFFYNESIHTLLKEENTINTKIDDYMTELQRIADKETYNQFKNKLDSTLLD